MIQNNIFLDTFKTLGTNAVPMAFGEVFTALETKTIDGQENPFVTINTSKFFEVQKYLSVTRHAYTPFLVLYSKKMWDTARRVKLHFRNIAYTLQAHSLVCNLSTRPGAPRVRVSFFVVGCLPGHS